MINQINRANGLMLLGLLTFVSCGPKEKEKSDALRKDMVGEWRNVYLKVTTNALGSLDSVHVTECDTTNWEKMLGIKPIRTFFLPDGTYRSEYYNLKDSLIMTNTVFSYVRTHARTCMYIRMYTTFTCVCEHCYFNFGGYF